MGRNDVNPATLERKKQKAQEIKKSKNHQNQLKLLKLSQKNPISIYKQIQFLEKQQRINKQLEPHDVVRLQSLKNELEEVLNAKDKMGVNDNTRELLKGWDEKNAKRYNNDDKRGAKDGKEDGRRIYGMKSIYWDPIWNPKGYVPKGYEFQERLLNENQENINDTLSDNDSGYSTSSSVSSIPLPKGPPPRKNQHEIAITTYESSGVVRDLAAETSKMIPVTLLRKKKKTNDGKSVNASVETWEPPEDEEDDSVTGAYPGFGGDYDYGLEDEGEEKEYASEEEEALRKLGRWDDGNNSAKAKSVQLETVEDDDLI